MPGCDPARPRPAAPRRPTPPATTTVPAGPNRNEDRHGIDRHGTARASSSRMPRCETAGRTGSSGRAETERDHLETVQILAKTREFGPLRLHDL